MYKTHVAGAWKFGFVAVPRSNHCGYVAIISPATLCSTLWTPTRLAVCAVPPVPLLAVMVKSRPSMRFRLSDVSKFLVYLNLLDLIRLSTVIKRLSQPLGPVVFHCPIHRLCDSRTANGHPDSSEPILFRSQASAILDTVCLSNFPQMESTRLQCPHEGLTVNRCKPVCWSESLQPLEIVDQRPMKVAQHRNSILDRVQ